MPAAPTLRDLARLAGVSANTVSKALRNHPKVSDERRAEIVALADAKGYRRNPALSTWMRHVRDARHPASSETLAYVTTRPRAETLRERTSWAYRYHAGAQAVAGRLGYRCATFALEDYARDWGRLFHVLHHRGVRGVAIGPLAGHAPPPLTEGRFALAAIESVAPDAPVDWVATDHYAGMLLALAAAKRHGHRRVGYVRSELVVPEHERWRAAFTLYQADIPAADRVPVFEPGRARERDLLAWWRRERPTVIVSSDNSMAARLRRAGVSIPAEVGFIALDRASGVGAIAGVDQHMEEVGAAVIRLLAMKLELNETGPVGTPRCLLVQPTWVEGRSL
jgi:DNA-binding LacI/PurR family transcriptional regulator